MPGINSRPNTDGNRPKYLCQVLSTRKAYKVGKTTDFQPIYNQATLNLGHQSISQEHLVAADGELLTLPKYNFIFEPWPEPHDFDTYGGKKLLKYNNEPLFAELVLLRLLEEEGYKGVWVDTYSNKFWQRLPHFGFPVTPNQKLLDVYEQIYQIKGGRRSGCFDVMAYRDDHFVFAELKRQNEDSIRPSQIQWLQAARALRLEDPDFIIVEWTTCS